MSDISPLACVSPDAVLGAGVKIGPFAVVESGAVLGEGCELASGAIVKSRVTLGARVRVHAYAVVGGFPQDYSFNPANRVGLRVGDDTIIREGVTISLATKDGQDTVIGKNCMLMAQSHVGHDCVVGDHVVMANCALLAGHVHIGDRAFISGGVGIHQFCRVGESAMLGVGFSHSADIPPYCMTGGRNAVVGLNLVGLRRRGFARNVIMEIKAAYRAVYFAEGANLRVNAEVALASGAYTTDEARRFLTFFLGGHRKMFARPRHVPGAAESAE